MEIFNLLIANAKEYKRKLEDYEIKIDDYKREINYLNKNREHLNKELLKEYGIENDLKEQLQCKNMITIPMEEYKELLIIKGKYEELKIKSQIQQPIIWNGYTEQGTTILPCRDTGEFQTTSPVTTSPYKITCKNETINKLKEE